jgi:deoxyadenosine/deoxycytidine kinase
MGRTDRAFRLEIAGIAGAGKSRLTDVLRRQPGWWEVADSLHTRKLRHVLYIVRSLPRVAALAAASAAALRRPTWDDMKYVMYVSQWHRYLAGHDRPSGMVTVLDQGPVFALARFRATAHPFTRTRAFDAWWPAMVRHWSRELNAIVWLDAPDLVLLERINTRSQAHETKGASVEDGRDFITRYRTAFEEVLASMSAAGRPNVLRFDTAEQSAEDIAAEIVAWHNSARQDATVTGAGAL